MAKRPAWTPRAMPEARHDLVRVSQAEATRLETTLTRALAAGAANEDQANTYRLTAQSYRMLAQNMAAATLFWIGREMSLLAMDASLDVPHLARVDAPAPIGIFAFEEPLPPIDTAALGGLVLRGRKGMVEYHDPVAVDAMAWNSWSSPEEGEEDMLAIHLMCRPERLPHPLIENQGRWFVPFAAIKCQPHIDFAEIEDLHPTAVALGSYLSSAWNLMATPGVAERRDTDTRTGQAATRQTPPSSRVSVIDLRPMRNVHAELDEKTGRKLTVRHVVRGHWRNQAYGQHRAQRKLTFIAPYIKGPEGAPLKTTSQRVYRWR